MIPKLNPNIPILVYQEQNIDKRDVSLNWKLQTGLGKEAFTIVFSILRKKWKVSIQ